ncbi:hypothetical protein BsWGS_20309 [Bradybaena similaris]
MASVPNVSQVDDSAVYHELSPKLILAVRIVNVITLVMVIIAIILCIVQASGVNGSYYLLLCNIVISGLVCLVVNWWYRKGDLGSEKYWFILLVAAVILFQCITTDLFVFKSNEVPVGLTTTPSHTTFNRTTRAVSWQSNWPASSSSQHALN